MRWGRDAGRPPQRPDVVPLSELGASEDAVGPIWCAGCGIFHVEKVGGLCPLCEPVEVDD